VYVCCVRPCMSNPHTLKSSWLPVYSLHTVFMYHLSNHCRAYLPRPQPLPGAGAKIIATIVTYPMIVVKSRLQAMGEHTAAENR
jgi:hypothetical protein